MADPVYLYQTNPVSGGGTHIGAIQGLMGIVTSERNMTQHTEQLYTQFKTQASCPWNSLHSLGVTAKRRLWKRASAYWID